jgi:hypothetical protein
VNLVAAVPAALAGVVLFVVPGGVFLSKLRREDREGTPLEEALFLMVAVSVAASAWVALVLAEWGRFSLVGAAFLVGVPSVVSLFLGRPTAWPFPAPARPLGLAAAGAVLALALALQARPGEYIVGGRDPGTYVATMAVIGRTGGIVYVDPVVRSIPREDVGIFYRHPGNPDFSWGRFMGFPLERPETGRVFPEFFHLFPAFGAYLFQAMGVRGALATPVVFGVLGTLAVFFWLRRLFGIGTALLGGLLLAVNVVQVWFARTPVSEPMSQFLLALGLLAFARWEAEDSAAFGTLAGAALGLSLLVRIDSVLVVAALGLYVFVRRAEGALPWRRALPLLLPFAFLAAHAGFHAAVFSRKYLSNITSRPYWKEPPEVWAGAIALASVAILLAERVGPRLVRRMERSERLLKNVATGVVVTLALYAYFLRPLLSAWAGGDGNDEGRALADPGLLLDLGFGRLAAHDAQAFLRLGWFVTPVGLAAGVLGLLVAIREWRRHYLFPLAVGLTFSAFYLYKIRVFADYFFALRRFVPVTIPLLLGLGAFFVLRLAQRGRVRRLLAAGLGLFLFLSFLRQTLPLARYVDWKGSVDFVRDVSRRFGPGDVAIFEQVKSVHLLSLPLWAVHGVNIVELARFDPDVERLHHLLRAWRGRYRNIYFVHTYRTDLCGLFLQHVEDYAFSTLEWERGYGRPPRGPEPRGLRFTLSRVVLPEELQVPPLREIDIGGSDDFQVSGFFDKEGGGDETFRWTGACASVYVPGASAGAGLIVRASEGQRPPAAPAPRVAVSLSGTPVGSFTAGQEWEDHRLRLPDPLPTGPPVLRFDVAAWRPVNFLEDSSDIRDLGIMVDRIGIVP